MIEERYEIIKLLGKGRTGGIYEAEDTNLGRKVAMRRFFAQNQQTDLTEYKEDFEKVAHSLSGLQHPNLLRVYDAGFDHDGAYIISQLLNGETLHDKIKNGPISTWEVNDLAQQMLDALSTAHKEGFVHGAITPGSILMTPRARGGYLYVILDMGLCRLAPLIQGKDSVLSIMADPAILAPELFGDDEAIEATERADLYMLGHILYMCLAGGHPFGGVPAEEAEKMHQQGLPALSEFNDTVPEDFRLWIERLTQINPDDRPVSAVEALNSLPKVQPPAKAPVPGSTVPTLNLSPATGTNLQSPAGAVTGPLSTFGVAPATPSSPTIVNTGPLSSATAVNPTVPAVSATTGLPVMEKKSSKKGLFIGLGALVAIGAIVGAIFLRGENTEDEKAKPGVNASADVSGDTGNSYAERNAVAAEKIIITHFDGAKPKNKGWSYVSPELQQVDENLQGRIMDSGKVKQMPGLRFPLRAYGGDMFDLGWKLTYVVNPIQGVHRVGFQISEKMNPGWEGGSVGVYLVIDRVSPDEIVVSLRGADNKIKKGKSKKIKYAGEKAWHTITVEQAPEEESGAYVVSIDDVKAFEDTFTIGQVGVSDLLYNFAFDKKMKGKWVIKEIKLETP